jgi:hypothetical protein
MHNRHYYKKSSSYLLWPSACLHRATPARSGPSGFPRRVSQQRRPAPIDRQRLRPGSAACPPRGTIPKAFLRERRRQTHRGRCQPRRGFQPPLRGVPRSGMTKLRPALPLNLPRSPQDGACAPPLSEFDVLLLSQTGRGGRAPLRLTSSTVRFRPLGLSPTPTRGRGPRRRKPGSRTLRGPPSKAPRCRKIAAGGPRPRRRRRSTPR